MLIKFENVVEFFNNIPSYRRTDVIEELMSCLNLCCPKCKSKDSYICDLESELESFERDL